MASTVADMDKFFPQQRDLLDEWIDPVQVSGA